MTVLEIGVIRNSTLVLHQSYYPLKTAKKEFTPERRSQILNQILQMSQKVLAEEIQSITNNNYRIFTQNSRNDAQSLTIYAITDSASDPHVVSRLLNSLIRKFWIKFPEFHQKPLLEITQFQNFRTIINETLLDERYKPSDRVKNYLF